MGRRREIIEIQTALKRIMADQKFRLHDLATALGISIATAKRLLNGEDLSMERVLEICELLGIDFRTLMEVISSKRAHYYYLTPEQEEYLAVRFSHFAYLRSLLKGATPEALSRLYGLSAADHRAYQRDLEKQGFLKILENGEVRLLVKDGMDWRVDGPLWKAFLPRWIEAVAKDFLADGIQQRGAMIDIGQKTLTSESYGAMKKEVDELSRKYTAISKVERRTCPADSLKTYNFLAILDDWQPNFWRVKKIRDVPDES